jgi:hypothetical protein
VKLFQRGAGRLRGVVACAENAACHARIQPPREKPDKSFLIALIGKMFFVFPLVAQVIKLNWVFLEQVFQNQEQENCSRAVTSPRMVHSSSSGIEGLAILLPIHCLPQNPNAPKESRPNPIDQYKPNGFVNDFAGIIDSRIKSELERICKALDQKPTTGLSINRGSPCCTDYVTAPSSASPAVPLIFSP